MRISNNFNFTYNNKPIKLNNYSSYPNLKPLPYDTVSFTSVKKYELEKIGLIMADKFNASLKDFNSKDDFNDWAEDQITIIRSKKYTSRKEEITSQRNSLLKEWFDYVTNEIELYSPSVGLFILNEITKDLRKDNEKIPPIFDKNALTATIKEIERNLENNKNSKINFEELYNNNLRCFYSNVDEDADENLNGWVVIPSEEHDPENFSQNVRKLKKLSNPIWHTRSFSAETQLKNWDIHIYYEDNEPKLKARLEDNTVAEIMNENNGTKIPQSYLEIAKDYIKKNDFQPSRMMQKEINSAETLKQLIDKARSKIGEKAIKENDPEVILPYFGIEIEKNDDGKYIISEFIKPDKIYTLEELGINLEELLKNVVEIKGDADFRGLKLENLPNLEIVGGSIRLNHSNLSNIPNLRHVRRNVNLMDSQIKTLPSLESIGRNIDFRYSKIKQLPELRIIGKNADFRNSQTINLPRLAYIGGESICSDSQVR